MLWSLLYVTFCQGVVVRGGGNRKTRVKLLTDGVRRNGMESSAVGFPLLFNVRSLRSGANASWHAMMCLNSGEVRTMVPCNKCLQQLDFDSNDTGSKVFQYFDGFW